MKYASLAMITDRPIDTSAVEEAVAGPLNGAVIIFNGVVRNHDGGRMVSALEYEAHPDAARFLEACCREVAASSGLALAAIHRVGHLEVGELALIAAVAAPHRTEAFDTCATLVERIKSGVPIWKRQYFMNMPSRWVGL